MRSKDCSQEEEEDRSKNLGADFVWIKRRPDHLHFFGPGQLVAYPVLNFRTFAPENKRKALLGIKRYV